MISLLEDKEELAKQKVGRGASFMSLRTGTGQLSAMLMGRHVVGEGCKLGDKT